MSDPADQVDQFKSAITERARRARERARRGARVLLEQVGLDQVAEDAAERLNGLRDEWSAGPRSNGRVIERLVADEIDRAAGRLGLARRCEVKALQDEVEGLQDEVEALQDDVTALRDEVDRLRADLATGQPTDSGPTQRADPARSGRTTTKAGKTADRKAGTAAKASPSRTAKPTGGRQSARKVSPPRQ